MSDKGLVNRSTFTEINAMASNCSDPLPSYDEVVNRDSGDLELTNEIPQSSKSRPTRFSGPPSYELQSIWRHDAIQGNSAKTQDESTLALADSYRQAGNYVKALECYRILYEIRLQIFEPISQSKKMSSVMHLIGFCLIRLEQHQESLEWTRRAITIKETQQPTLDLAVSYSNYALALEKSKRYKEALKYYKNSMKIKNDFISGDAETKAETLYNIGVLYREGLSNYAKSLDYLNQALGMLERKLLETYRSHIKIANCLYHIAVTHYRQKDYSQSVAYFRQSLTQFKDIRPSEPYHEDIERTICALGNVYYNVRDYFSAEAYYKKLVGIRKAKLSRENNHVKLISAYHNLFFALKAQHKIREAHKIEKLRNQLSSDLTLHQDQPGFEIF